MNKRFLTTIAILPAIALLAATAAGADSFTLTENGQPRARIVVGSQPPETVAFAARELRDFVQKAAATTQYDQKLWLAQRAGQLLDSVRALKGAAVRAAWHGQDDGRAGGSGGTGHAVLLDQAVGYPQPILRPERSPLGGAVRDGAWPYARRGGVRGRDRRIAHRAVEAMPANHRGGC